MGFLDAAYDIIMDAYEKDVAGRQKEMNYSDIMKYNEMKIRKRKADAEVEAELAIKKEKDKVKKKKMKRRLLYGVTDFSDL